MSPEIRRLELADLGLLDHCESEVFDEPVNPGWARTFLEDPRHHLVVAIEDGRIVGFASGVHTIHPDKPTEMFVNEIGVAPRLQRRGIGRALLQRLLQHAADLRCEAAWVLAEGDDENANAFYQSFGTKPEAVMLYELPLPGPQDAR